MDTANFTTALGLDWISHFNFEDLKLHLLQQTAYILEHVLISVLVYVIVCLCLYRVVIRWRVFSPNRFPDKFKRILIVTAHPDDECMFFGPTILSLCRRSRCQVFLLCLSNGNYDKQGHLRRNELWNSCKTLEMWPENVVMCNVTELQDDPNSEWKLDIVGRVIKRYVDVLDIQAIVTFDRDGVSRHLNHINIYYAVTSLYLTKALKESGKQTMEGNNENFTNGLLYLFSL